MRHKTILTQCVDIRCMPFLDENNKHKSSQHVPTTHAHSMKQLLFFQHEICKQVTRITLRYAKHWVCAHKKITQMPRSTKYRKSPHCKSFLLMCKKISALWIIKSIVQIFFRCAKKHHYPRFGHLGKSRQKVRSHFRIFFV